MGKGQGLDIVKLTAHFDLAEFTRSNVAAAKGIDNTPPPDVSRRLWSVAGHMEMIRALLGRPINIHSGYRCKALNDAVGGVSNSAHMSGYAVDFTCPEYGSPYKVARDLAGSPSVSFDQLICEGTWVHISFDPKMRRELFTLQGGQYRKGILK
jgi:zinc D-Ala-D-Ala carboxypeptidase